MNIFSTVSTHLTGECASTEAGGGGAGGEEWEGLPLQAEVAPGSRLFVPKTSSEGRREGGHT